VKHHLFNLTAALSLLVCLALVVLWVRSYFAGDTFDFFARDKWETMIWFRSGVITWYEHWSPDAVDRFNPKRQVVIYHVPCWPIALASAVLPALWFAHRSHGFLKRRRRVARIQRAQCERCGYDLRATPERCPECGAMPEVKGCSRRFGKVLWRRGGESHLHRRH
jgi:hypothetical protein